MYTLCPDCLTVFRVQAAQLNAAAGQVQCGHCGTDFPAMGRLYDEVLDAQAARMAQQPVVIPEPEPGAGVASGGGPAEPAVLPPSHEGDRDFFAQLAAHDSPETPESVEPVIYDDWDAFGQPGPEVGFVTAVPEAPVSARSVLEAELLAELEEPPTAGISARTGWGLAASFLLLALFAGQFIHMHREQWAQDPRWRPWLEVMCQVAQCELPLRRDVSSIELLERDVRNHPRVDEAVLINAVFVNRADFVQPYPVFEVGFSDLGGTLVARRRFSPDEYLADADMRAGMPPGRTVNVRLEVMDPGRRAVSFKLEFL